MDKFHIMSGAAIFGIIIAISLTATRERRVESNYIYTQADDVDIHTSAPDGTFDEVGAFHPVAGHNMVISESPNLKGGDIWTCHQSGKYPVVIKEPEHTVTFDRNDCNL